MRDKIISKFLMAYHKTESNSVLFSVPTPGPDPTEVAYPEFEEGLTELKIETKRQTSLYG